LVGFSHVSGGVPRPGPGHRLAGRTVVVVGGQDARSASATREMAETGQGVGCFGCLTRAADGARWAGSMSIPLLVASNHPVKQEDEGDHRHGSNEEADWNRPPDPRDHRVTPFRVRGSGSFNTTRSGCPRYPSR
jgi:hypothetical protein